MTETKTKTRLEDKVWFTPEECMEYSGIGRTRIYRLLANDELPSAKLGRTRHVKRVDLDRFLEGLMSTSR